ncbi:UNVERIFIED_CONTAM: hypothetical protein Sangu_0779500 [Sesamum angustifolium]|uniref:Uncharacterized protein n=1 Tax=Sesamum angustifolium TaxID=2727405 RepID=A0AAW2PV60_9LAMI
MEKKKKKKKESFEKRIPLQHLNPPQFHTPITKNISNPSSSSVSFEAPKGCLRFKLPSNFSSSDPSSSFYSSRTHLPTKPKPLSTIPKNVPHKSTAVALNFTHRSKENVVPRKPFSLKSKKYQPPCLGPRQCARTTTKPNCRNPRIPNLSSGKGNPGSKLNQGSQELEANLKRQNGSGEPPIELLGGSIGSCTPAGKIGGGRGLDSVNSDGHENVGKESISETASGDSATSLKTPPVEASVSPEIPCGFQSKVSFPESSATPVCYGAGHLLLGVTDKRKCRRRGSFKGGCEKINLFYDGKNDRNVVCDSQDSSIPLLAEASVRWLLSPCDEGCEDLRSDSENRLQKCQTIHCNASPTLDLLSSPSTVCGDVSELGCAICNSSGSGSVGGAASKREDEILVLSPGKTPELGCSEEKMHEHLLITTPNSTSNCNAISAGEEKNFRHNVIENDCALSLGSLSGGNIIQTPNSDSRIDGCSGRTKDRCELFLITETLNKVGLSPRKNLALSHVRISWRDGLVNRIDENDECDSCRCLSDEEVDADGFSDTKLSSSPVSQSRRGRETDEEMKSCLGSHLGDESGANEGNDLGIDNDALPLLLSYEPCISALGKEKRLPNNAESICTNGGDLVASGDSDWTYLRDDHLFQVE